MSTPMIPARPGVTGQRCPCPHPPAPGILAASSRCAPCRRGSGSVVGPGMIFGQVGNRARAFPAGDGWGLSPWIGYSRASAAGGRRLARWRDDGSAVLPLPGRRLPFPRAERAGKGKVFRSRTRWMLEFIPLPRNRIRPHAGRLGKVGSEGSGLLPASPSREVQPQPRAAPQAVVTARATSASVVSRAAPSAGPWAR